MSQLAFIEAGPAPDPSASQWFTPEPIARELAWLAQDMFTSRTFYRGRLRAESPLRVLEPSAGRGALIRAIFEVESNGRAPHTLTVDAVERDPRWAEQLADLPRVRVETCCYLERPAPAQRYDLAITNPPYDGGVETQHLAKMLDECERILALLPARSLHGVARYEWVWSRFQGPGQDWWLHQQKHLIRRPSFGEGGGKDEIVLLDMQRVQGACSVGWL